MTADDLEAEFDRRVRAARVQYFEDLKRAPWEALGLNQSRYFAICKWFSRQPGVSPSDRRYSSPDRWTPRFE